MDRLPQDVIDFVRIDLEATKAKKAAVEVEFNNNGCANIDA
ncbi:uncharacterized protein G2W53_014515 [Senna tora]|uniref:Uncharacterized protein n=1 Tax=Senna tora TaxID=362788 RepID=A0A834WTS2_9FABA|nr:uncharacterized protein G2W53_014515 [Senna tora]